MRSTRRKSTTVPRSRQRRDAGERLEIASDRFDPLGERLGSIDAPRVAMHQRSRHRVDDVEQQCGHQLVVAWAHVRPVAQDPNHFLLKPLLAAPHDFRWLLVPFNYGETASAARGSASWRARRATRILRNTRRSGRSGCRRSEQVVTTTWSTAEAWRSKRAATIASLPGRHRTEGADRDAARAAFWFVLTDRPVGQQLGRRPRAAGLPCPTFPGEGARVLEG